GVRPQKPYVTPRALETSELPGIVSAFRRGAANAKRAGFDGVEIHGANGYLVDQFLRDSANFRDDHYGGSIENRIRFTREVLQAVGDEIGMDRVGIRFSPNIYVQGVEDSDPVPLYAELAKALEELKVPWIELREPDKPTSAGSIPTTPVSPAMRPHYSGRIVINSDHDWSDARGRIADGHADAVSIGRLFIANPDLVKRIAIDAPLNPGDPSTFYSGGPEGYVDYPALAEQEAA
ncbi:MAG TPA: alkene reductase, partial [Sphingomicrobium sp.]|nr:alkene reductase [Sphingomicrobium sp.]